MPAKKKSSAKATRRSSGVAKKAVRRSAPKKRVPAKRKTSSREGSSSGKRELNKERTRQRILKAALDLFRKKGFQSTTTKEISVKAKIAEGTLFNYFETKEDLALYFFDQLTEDVMDWFKQEPSLKKAPVTEKLFALIHRHLEKIEPYEDFIGAVYYRALQPRSKLHPLSFDSQERNMKYLRFFESILTDAERKEEIPPLGQVGPYAIGLFYIGIVTYWLHDYSPGKQRTLAFLDRSLKLGTTFLKKGSWEW